MNIPNYVDETYNIEVQNRNNYWQDAIKKELDKVRVDFKERKVTQ